MTIFTVCILLTTGFRSALFVCGFGLWFHKRWAMAWQSKQLLAFKEDLAVGTTETLLNLYQSTRRCKPEHSHFRTHRRENLKSYCIRFPNVCPFDNQSNLLWSGTTEHQVSILVKFLMMLFCAVTPCELVKHTWTSRTNSLPPTLGQSSSPHGFTIQKINIVTEIQFIHTSSFRINFNIIIPPTNILPKFSFFFHFFEIFC
jgi:hypothetical protein